MSTSGGRAVAVAATAAVGGRPAMRSAWEKQEYDLMLLLWKGPPFLRFADIAYTVRYIMTTAV